jgi:tetraacyldisaccharide 4'-kinase
MRARDGGADAVVLDDAFQHRSIARDVDIVILSADDPFPGALLPRGPYRERARALARADVVVVTRRLAGVDRARQLAARAEEHAPGKVIACAEIAPGAWRRLGSAAPASADGPEGSRGIVSACGVARADAFRRVVARIVRAEVEQVGFADHHAYTRADVARLTARAAGRPIVVTEKDAVKLEAWTDELPDAWVLAEVVRWDWGAERLAETVRP